MRDESVHETIQKALVGALMVLMVSQLLIRSASLSGPAYIPWLWAAGFCLSALLAAVLPPGVKSRIVMLAGTGVILLAMGGALVPLIRQSIAGSAAQSDLVQTGLGQLAAYLAGAEPALPDVLQELGLHWLCAATALLFLWLRIWTHRSALLGVVLVFGILRWYQAVPGLEEQIRNVVLVWIFTAAVPSDPLPAGANGATRITGHVLMALLLTAGVFAGSAALSVLFPLEKLNHWIGVRLPVQEHFRNEYTQYASTGFALADTFWHPLGDRLGGPVTLEKQPVMAVRSSRPGLYLRGAVRTVYTGQAWEYPDPAPMSGAPETLAGAAEPFVLTIHPFNDGDLTVYTPLHTDRVLAAHRKIQAAGEGLYRFGFQWFPQSQQDYRVEGYLVGQPPASAPDLTPYLQLPALSEELKALTVSITADQNTDAGRMARLAAWLRTEGTYRLDVPPPDPARDFVEQFVLGSREGYCTYYATALAVMGRLAGVPTRYVEGYHLPESFTGRQTYLVTSDRAHAWVEAYIANKGWVTYEPTPVFGTASEGGVPVPAPVTADSEPRGDREADGNAPAESSDKLSGSLRGLAGIIFLMLGLLMGLRMLWVERSWRRGETGPQGALWQLYAILSALILLAPELKRLGTPADQLRAVNAIFPFRGFASHDIIGEANRLLYGKSADAPAGFRELLTELWAVCRVRQGTGQYLYRRYISLALFNSYTPLISHRQFRKDVHHGADQPHTSPQS